MVERPVKAKADHAQQVATSALHVASAAASTSRTYAQTAASSSATVAAASPKPSTSQGRPAAKASKPAAPAALPSAHSKKPTPAATPAPGVLVGPTQTLRPPRVRIENSEWPHAPTNTAGPPCQSATWNKLPREAAIFTATINDNGTVSLTAPQGHATSYYAPYYKKATQHHIAPEINAYEAFRPAPTSDSLLTLLINRVPISALPSDPTLLQETIADAVCLSTGIAIGSARTLLSWDKITKLTTSIVIQAPPTYALTLI